MNWKFWERKNREGALTENIDGSYNHTTVKWIGANPVGTWQDGTLMLLKKDGTFNNAGVIYRWLPGENGDKLDKYREIVEKKEGEK